MSQIDWTATGTWALAIIAFGSFWIQFYFSQKQLRDTRKGFEDTLAVQREVSRNDIGVRLFLQMTERFDSPRMHKNATHQPISLVILLVTR
jgi:hypothetical protein